MRTSGVADDRHVRDHGTSRKMITEIRG